MKTRAPQNVMRIAEKSWRYLRSRSKTEKAYCQAASTALRHKIQIVPKKVKAKFCVRLQKKDRLPRSNPAVKAKQRQSESIEECAPSKWSFGSSRRCLRSNNKPPMILRWDYNTEKRQTSKRSGSARFFFAHLTIAEISSISRKIPPECRNAVKNRSRFQLRATNESPPHQPMFAAAVAGH